MEAVLAMSDARMPGDRVPEEGQFLSAVPSVASGRHTGALLCVNNCCRH